MAALPPQLRALNAQQLGRRFAANAKHSAQSAPAQLQDATVLTPEQKEVLARVETGDGPFLLFGATGSGKTEVYLQAAMRVLAKDADAQVLVMVPEINLTPSWKRVSVPVSSRFMAQPALSACTAA